MKIIEVVWRDPSDSLRTEQFEEDKFKVHTESGWFKLFSKEEGHVVRLIPSCHVRLVQFGEAAEKPRILRPPEAPFPDALVKGGN